MNEWWSLENDWSWFFRLYLALFLVSYADVVMKDCVTSPTLEHLRRRLTSFPECHVTRHCDTCLDMMVVGYFQVVRMGSVAEMKDLSGEKRRVVVLKYYPDKGSVTVVDVKSRKRKMVMNSSLIFA